jgi:soluble lytic murein transglycosylase-like protein
MLPKGAMHMGFMDRISAIEGRMHEIQGRLNGLSHASEPPMMGQTNFDAAMTQAQTAAEAPQGSLPPNALPTDPSSLTSLLPGLVHPDAHHATPGGTPNEFDGIIKEASEKWGIEENFIKAVITQESGFNPSARSKVGAMGLMQLMPETAASLGVKDAMDPRENVMGGTRYLKGLLDRFNGDKKLALAAYNAGAGSVNKYGGIPPFPETQNYVQSIMAHYQRMKG